MPGVTLSGLGKVQRTRRCRSGADSERPLAPRHNYPFFSVKFWQDVVRNGPWYERAMTAVRRGGRLRFYFYLAGVMVVRWV